MNTPICDFVQAYAESQKLRFHMPGHKGIGALGIEHLDITEIDGADVLYRANGIIKESEANASALFGTALTKYSTEGSSLSIRAMLYLAAVHAKSIGREPKILAGRNAHHTFMTAAALLNLNVEWLYPEHWENLVSCEISAEYLDRVLSDMQVSVPESLHNDPMMPTAVYITSPDYLGNVADIAGLSQVCHKHGVLLLVDNAHGAYMNFLPVNRHPIALGADICCDSAHKTLPVLTGGGYLHISKQAAAQFCPQASEFSCQQAPDLSCQQAPDFLFRQAEKALSLFASTSPSYLIMQSLDACNRYLSEGYRERLAAFVKLVDCVKIALTDYGYTLLGDEPLKITLAPKPFGYTGEELASLLLEKGIVCEFVDLDFLVLMVTPEITESELMYLMQLLCSIPRKDAISSKPPMLSKPKQLCSIREALFSASREVSVSDSLGQTLASTRISCPPAIPIVVCGERIDEDAIRCLEYYGVETCAIICK